MLFMGKILPPQPTLIFVAGGPAVGKTTLIKNLLAKLNNVVYLGMDAIRDTFLRTPDKSKEYGISWYALNGPQFSRESNHYKEHVGLHSYHTPMELAIDNLLAGFSVIIEGNYTSQIPMGYFSIIVPTFLKSKGLNPKVKLIFINTDKKIVAERLKKRNAWRDSGKLKSDQKLWEYLDSQNFLPVELSKHDHLKIDGAKNNDKNTEIALKYILE